MATREELLAQLNELKALRSQIASEDSGAGQASSFLQGATPRTWGDTLNSVESGAVGVSEGYLKGLPQVITRPLDLAVRGGNWLAESMGAEPVDITPNLPTNLWKSGVDQLVGNLPSNQTAQTVGEIGGMLPGLVAAPSAIAPTMAATKGMSMIPRGLTVGAAAAPEGAAWGAAFEAANQNPEYGKGMATGAGFNFAAGAAAPLLSQAAKDTGAMDGFNKLMGYNPEAKASVAGGVDASGNITQDASRAVAQVSKKDIKLQELRDSGFINTIKATDSPSDVSLKLWQFQQNAGKNIGDTIDAAAQAEQQFAMRAGTEDLGWWQSLNDFVNEPKYVGTPEQIAAAAPDFSGSQEFIESIAMSDPMTATRLQNRLDSVRAAWESSDQSLGTFKNMQENLGITGKSTYSPSKTSADNLSDTLNNIMYGEVAGSLKRRVAVIGEAMGNPNLGKQFEEANKAYSSAVTFKDSAFNASRQSVGSRVLPGLTAKALGRYLGPAGAGYAAGGLPGAAIGTGIGAAANAMPVQAMKAMQGAQALMEMSSKVPLGNVAIGAFQSILPRNFAEVKQDPKAMADLAMRAQVPFDVFTKLPEPLQSQIHTQVILSDPNAASPMPGNYNIVNGKFMDPMEKDFFIDSYLDKPPVERALAISAAFEGKYTAPSVNSTPSYEPEPFNYSIDTIYNSLDNSYEVSPEMGSQLSQLEKATAIHAEDF